MPLPAGPEAPVLAWEEAAPGQGGPAPLPQAPALTRVFFPQEPEAERGCDDSDCADTETPDCNRDKHRYRGKERDTETQIQKRQIQTPERGRDTRERQMQTDRHRDIRRQTQDLT